MKNEKLLSKVELQILEAESGLSNSSQPESDSQEELRSMQIVEESAAVDSASAVDSDSVNDPLDSELSGPACHFSKYGVNTEFDGYSLEKVLGEGASGVVFKATRISGGLAVSIKVFRKELLRDAEAVRRFEKEIQILKMLSHPNIVSIIGSGILESGAPYMVGELIQGQSIRNQLDEGLVFEPRAVASVTREVCRALHYAHTQSIIHRDLKPSNIIVDDNGIAKVVDFGVAKAIGYTGDTITQIGAFVGTPSYMSPEQCLGHYVDARSDIYSVGCTMFEMLTGVQAFASANPVEAIAQQVSDDRTHIRKALQTDLIPRDLREIIYKCLDREPANRYQSIAELDHDLSAFLLGKRISARNRCRKRWLLPAIVATNILIVAGFYLYSHTSSTPQPLPPPTRVYAAPPPPLPVLVTNIEIVNRRTGKVIYRDSATDMRIALKNAGQKKVSLREADLHGANLVQADLRSLDLRDADLSGARMTQAHLTDVNLSGANLNEAELRQARLAGVNLDRASLVSAVMVQCKAPSIKLNGANLSKADLTQAVFSETQCKKAQFTSANLCQAHFNSSNCNAANFSDAALTQADFSDASLVKANFSEADGSQIRANGANLNDASMGSLRLDETGYLTENPE